MPTVRTLLAVATIRGWPLWKIYVNNAFLHGNLRETVFMKPPPGYVCPPNHVCHLHKSLYGLKQAPRAWFEIFPSAIIQAGFHQSPNDNSLFVKRTTRGSTCLLLYVDDMIITGNDVSGITSLKTYLMRSFKMKDLGPLTYFLGLEISRSKAGVSIRQKKYAEDVLSLAHLTDSKLCDTPLELKAKLRKDDGSPLPDPTMHRRLVGSLIYLTMTRPDVSHAVQIVSQFVSNPHKPHLAAVHRILCYIQGTMDRGLFYSSTSSLELRCYADADWAGCQDTRRSTTGWCMFLGSSLISWKCNKQPTVSKSSAEVENRSMSSASSEVIWLRRFLL
ncbi:uncharacterized mitochondrial protein AtMg00810-like [Cornus florida]|uniref:uncharacterized mitochondrial protein AtMg00810-like n=1 Tax=Cornus florida TaxID=4283 RepID=UPI00289807E2|nr:uncharacterized mitochondrial protein AtMg00810-like [Cornus florida]